MAKETAMGAASALGEWLDSGIRNVPRGPLMWEGKPRRAYVAMVNGVAVATVRKSLGGWQARMSGWVWKVTPDMPSARFNLEIVPVRGFKTSREAKKAIESAYAQLPEKPTGDRRHK